MCGFDIFCRLFNIIIFCNDLVGKIGININIIKVKIKCMYYVKVKFVFGLKFCKLCFRFLFFFCFIL